MPGSQEASSYFSLRSSASKSGHGGSAPGAGHGEASASPPDIVYRRSALINELSPSFDQKGRLSSPEQSVNVIIPPETMEIYSVHLESYSKQLQQLKVSNPKLWESDFMAQNRAVFEKIITGEQPDPVKIQAFLSESPQNFMAATGLLGDYAEDLYAAIGKRVEYIPQNKKDSTRLRGDIHLDVDRGLLNKVWDRFGDKDYLAKAGTAAGLSAGLVVGAAGGGLKGAASVAATGALAGLAYKGVKAVQHSMRKGDVLKLVDDPLAFKSVKDDPEKRAFIEGMTGLNLDKFAINGGVVTPPTGEGDKALIKRIENQAYDGLLAGMTLKNALGADMTTNYQRLTQAEFSSTPNGPQTVLDTESQRRFQEKLKSLPDRWGQTSDDPCYLKANCAVGQPIRTTVDTNVTTLTAPGTPGETRINEAKTKAQEAALNARQARGEARRVNAEVNQAVAKAEADVRSEIFKEEMKKQLEGIKLEEKNYYDPLNPAQVEKRRLEIIDLMRKARLEANVTVVAKAIQDKLITESKAKLSKDDALLEAKVTEVGTQDTKKKEELQKKQGEMQAVIETAQKDELVYKAQRDAEKTIQEAEDAFYMNFSDASMDAAETRISDLLDTDGPGSIRARHLDIETRVSAEYDRLMQGKFGTPLNFKGFDNKEIERSKSEFAAIARGGVLGAEAAQLAEEKQKLEGERTKLAEIRQTINQKKREVAQNDTTKKIEELQDSLESSLGELLTWKKQGTVPGITQKELATKSYDEIVEHINLLHSENNSIGWAKELNDDPSKRDKLLHAMEEARGRAEELKQQQVPGSDFADRFNLYTDLTNKNIWNLSDTQLRTLSTTELTNILTVRAHNSAMHPTLVGPIVVPGVAEIEKAIQYAKDKVAIREDQTKKLADELRAQKETVRVEELGVDSKDTKEKIEERRRITSRATANESIYGKTEEIEKHSSEYFETADLPKHDAPRGSEYTDAERALGAPEGYYKWLQFITNYQEDTGRPDRQEAFKKASEVIKPEMLASALNDSLDLGLPMTAVTIEQALDALKAKGTITSVQGFDVVKTVMERLNQEAKTTI